MPGPLAGLRVLELQGKGPGPFAAMVLSDLGAEVVRVGRTEDVVAVATEDVLDGSVGDGAARMIAGQRQLDTVARGRRWLAVDLKQPEGVETVLRLVERADVLLEGFRPGVAERLGVGPQTCLARNPRLVYGRITGWGQDGPYAHTAGHDVNYVALAGALDPLRRGGATGPNGRALPPAPPLNMLGDYGGGGMLMVIGILAALVERANSGKGQVVDAAMVDGVALLTTVLHGLRAENLWSDEPGSNILDLAAPFYNVYETSDERYVSIGCGEPKFYKQLLALLGLGDELLATQSDESTWPASVETIAAVFRTKSLAEWTELLEGTDVCFAPVLTLAEAPEHAHNVARETFVELDGVVQPNTAPRFSRTPSSLTHGPRPAGSQSSTVLSDWGFATDEIAVLLKDDVVREAKA
jgi:alpha-methylacyl-CoA racemase